MSDLISYIDEQKQFFIPVISDDEILWESEKQFAIQAISGNDFACKIAQSNPTSLQNALINVAAIGISLNPALKHAYLVPRKGKICLDVSYMGLLHLAQSSGAILWGQSKLVRKADKYLNIGLSKEPRHEYEAFGERGDVVGCFCVVKLPNGDFITEEMNINEIHKIRGRSESFKKNSGPWVTDEDEMSRKTVIKRGSKYWPKCERLGSAIKMLDEQGEGIEIDVTPSINTEHNPAIEVRPKTDLEKVFEQGLSKVKSGNRSAKQILAWAKNNKIELTEEMTQKLTDAEGK